MKGREKWKYPLCCDVEDNINIVHALQMLKILVELTVSDAISKHRS